MADKKVKISVKKYYKTDTSYITVVDNNLLVMNNFSPCRSEEAIKICKGFYIELGRPISQFENVLAETRVPIMLEFVTKRLDYEHYNIIRMQTGNIDDTILGTVVCKNGIMMRLTCNQTCGGDEEYRKYEKLGSLWKLRSPYEACKESNIKRAVDMIQCLMGVSSTMEQKVTSEYTTNKMDISLEICNNTYQFTLILNEKTRMYELVMITFVQG